MADLHASTVWVRRRYLRFRRVIAAVLAATAALLALRSITPPAAPTSPVVVVNRDLDAGAVLTSDDLRLVPTGPDQKPSHSYATLEDVVGEALAAPVRAGEAVTDRRLVGRALLQGYPPDLVASPVRVPDADVPGLLHVGDRVDVYAADGNARATAAVVAADVQVVTLPEPSDDMHDGGLLVVAVTNEDAARLAQASATTALSVSLRG